MLTFIVLFVYLFIDRVQSATITTTTPWNTVWSSTAAWVAVASDSTGQYLAACSTSACYKSTTYGSPSPWTQLSGGGFPSTYTFNSVAISTSGTYVTVSSTSYYWWVSSNSGSTWTQKQSSSSYAYQVTMSSTGTYQAIASGAGPYISSNSGSSFTLITSNSVGYREASISMSSSGILVAALEFSSAYIDISYGYGATME